MDLNDRIMKNLIDGIEVSDDQTQKSTGNQHGCFYDYLLSKCYEDWKYMAKISEAIEPFFQPIETVKYGKKKFVIENGVNKFESKDDSYDFFNMEYEKEQQKRLDKNGVILLNAKKFLSFEKIDRIKTGLKSMKKAEYNLNKECLKRDYNLNEAFNENNYRINEPFIGIDCKIDESDYKIDENDYKIDENDYKIDENDYKIDESDYKIDENDYKIDENDYKIDESDCKIDESDCKIDENDYKINESDCNNCKINESDCNNCKIDENDCNNCKINENDCNNCKIDENDCKIDERDDRLYKASKGIYDRFKNDEVCESCFHRGYLELHIIKKGKKVIPVISEEYEIDVDIEKETYRFCRNKIWKRFHINLLLPYRIIEISDSMKLVFKREYSEIEFCNDNRKRSFAEMLVFFPILKINHQNFIKTRILAFYNQDIFSIDLARDLNLVYMIFPSTLINFDKLLAYIEDSLTYPQGDFYMVELYQTVIILNKIFNKNKKNKSLSVNNNLGIKLHNIDMGFTVPSDSNDHIYDSFNYLSITPKIRSNFLNNKNTMVSHNTKNENICCDMEVDKKIDESSDINNVKDSITCSNTSQLFSYENKLNLLLLKEKIKLVFLRNESPSLFREYLILKKKIIDDFFILFSKFKDFKLIYNVSHKIQKYKKRGIFIDKTFIFDNIRKSGVKNHLVLSAAILLENAGLPLVPKLEKLHYKEAVYFAKISAAALYTSLENNQIYDFYDILGKLRIFVNIEKNHLLNFACSNVFHSVSFKIYISRALEDVYIEFLKRIKNNSVPYILQNSLGEFRRYFGFSDFFKSFLKIHNICNQF